MEQLDQIVNLALAILTIAGALTTGTAAVVVFALTRFAKLREDISKVAAKLYEENKAQQKEIEALKSKCDLNDLKLSMLDLRVSKWEE